MYTPRLPLVSFLIALVLATTAPLASAEPFAIGAFSTSVTVPPDPPSPGVVDFHILNLTGPGALPPDFVLPSLVFEGTLRLWGYVDLAGDTLADPALVFEEEFSLSPTEALWAFSASTFHRFTLAELLIDVPPLLFEWDGSWWQSGAVATASLTLPGTDIIGEVDPVVISVEAERLPASVPEPATWLLVGGGAVIAAWRRRSRRNAPAAPPSAAGVN